MRNIKITTTDFLPQTILAGTVSPNELFLLMSTMSSKSDMETIEHLDALSKTAKGTYSFKETLRITWETTK